MIELIRDIITLPAAWWGARLARLRADATERELYLVWCRQQGYLPESAEAVRVCPYDLRFLAEAR